jgi:excisionase family DNA binding protein
VKPTWGATRQRCNNCTASLGLSQVLRCRGDLGRSAMVPMRTRTTWSRLRLALQVDREVMAIAPEAGAAMALRSCALKRPKRAMVGGWSGLDNRPVRLGIQHSDPGTDYAPSSPVSVECTPRSIRTGAAAGVHRRKGCAVAAQRSGKAATIYPSYLRTAEVADLLHVSPKTVSRWAKEGKLPFLKTLGGHRRYPEAEIRNLAAELRQEATA